MKLYSKPLAVSVKNPKVPYWWMHNSGQCWLNINYVNHRLLLQIYIKDGRQSFLVTLPKKAMYKLMKQLHSVGKITGNENNTGKWYVSKKQLVAMLQSKQSKKENCEKFK